MQAKPAITPATFEITARKWLTIVRYNESGIVLNFVGDHYYTIPQVIANSKLRRQVLGKYHAKYIFCYLELTKHTTDKHVKLALSRTLTARKIALDNPAMPVEEIVENLVELGYEIVFVLSRAEILLTHNHKLLSQFEGLSRNNRVSCIYFSEQNLTNSKFKSYIRQYPSLVQNIVYLPVYDEKDTEYFITFNERLWHMTVAKNIREEIISQFSGDLWLLREAIRLVRNNPAITTEELLIHPNLLSKAELVWEQLFKNERYVVSKALSGKYITKDEQPLQAYLLKIRFITKGANGAFNLYIPYLKNVIDNKQKRYALRAKQNYISYQGKSISNDLTKQEEKILYALLTRKNTALTREEIADVLWKHPEKEYSDWAIDKLVSRIRHKLRMLGLPKNTVATIRGKGYVLRD